MGLRLIASRRAPSHTLSSFLALSLACLFSFQILYAVDPPKLLKKEQPRRERKYKMSDIKDKPSVFEETIREPSKWERFLTITAAITLLWTGGIGEVNYRGGNSSFRAKTRPTQ